MEKLQFKRIKTIFTLFMVFGVTWLSAQNIESASRGEKIEDIKACLAKGADPNFKYEKQTILCHSINRKSHEITIFLANAKGIRINEYSIRPEPELSWKFTALMKAAEFPDLVKLFLDKGAGIDLQDDWLRWNGELDASGGNTPLMLSVAEFTESAKILIDRGAKLEIQNRSGQTALMKSVVNTEIAKILIDKGAKLDVQDKSGLTALMYAAEKYNDVVKLLLDKGANIVIRSANQMKSLDILSGISASHVSPNALDIAAMHGNIEGAKLIMAKAVSLGVKDEVIYSSLFWAVIYDQVAMAKYLLDEGAKIEGTDELGSYTPLMQTSLYEMVELLVKRGANVNAKSKFNYSPLYKAVFNFIEGKRKEKDCYKIINLLLEKGANPDTQDGNGVTPLMTAVQKIDVAKLLVAKGANINIKNNNGETALMYAVKGGLIKVAIFVPIVGGSVESTKLLVSKGADIDVQDKWGKTALMHAAGAVNAQGNSYGTYTDILKFLVDKGAKLEIQDKEGHTALYWAQRYNRTKSSDYLLSKGANPSQKYDKKKDKSNLAAGLVGTWINTFNYNTKGTYVVKNSTIAFKTKVIFNTDWSYSKVQVMQGQVVPDGSGYNSYELRDGRIWLFNSMGTNAVIEYRFEGKTLILNGEKYVKASK